MNPNLHDRIANILGWSVQDVRSMSLATLRDVVQPVSPKMSREIGIILADRRHYIRPEPAAEQEPETWTPTTYATSIEVPRHVLAGTWEGVGRREGGPKGPSGGSVYRRCLRSPGEPSYTRFETYFALPRR